MRFLVTGASGFVGRALVPRLRGDGHEVLAPTRVDLDGPVTQVVAELAASAPDVVIHLATHFVAEHTLADIPALIRANIELGVVAAETCVASGARLVTVGTAWQHVGGRDYDPVSLYAATKQAFDDIAVYYARVKGLDIREATLFDTYGPHDTRRKLVPALLDAARSGAPLDMSDGTQLIDLTYVDDVAAALADLAIRPEAPPSVVVRSWQPVRIRDLVGVVESVAGRPLDTRWGARLSRPREMTSDWVFGAPLPEWSPRVDLTEGLRRCWDAMDGST